MVSEKEAKFHRDKHIIESNPNINKPNALACDVSEENYNKIIKDNNDPRKKLPEHYEKIQNILKKYVVMDESYYPMIALWIIGTYVHSQFNTFPLLFINATKGSGKSRLLKLIISLSKSGKVVNDLRESVLFRTAQGNTIGIDEFENVSSKEMSTLRTMLNSAYKKGVGVERMKEMTKDGKKEYVVERFELFTPIALANIWGLEEVLSDRCLTILLDKSSDPIKTRLIEDFDTNPDILSVKRTFEGNQCSLCSVVTPVRTELGWNDFLLSQYYTTTYTTNTTYNYTNYTTYLHNIIFSSEIDGRDLELFFPLFTIAGMIGKEVLDDFLITAKNVVSEKKHEEYTENKDVSFIDFVSRKQEYQISYVSVGQLSLEFKQFILYEEDETKWLNAKWVGRALKRLKLITSKKRQSKGIEVTLDVAKAKEKLRVFK